MDLEDAESWARFLIRDRDGKFPGLFVAVLKDAGIEVVLSGVQMCHRSHWTLQAATPLRRPPEPIADPEQIAHLDARRRTGSAAPSTSTGMLPDQHG